jgi:hypothetical protein
VEGLDFLVTGDTTQLGKPLVPFEWIASFPLFGPSRFQRGLSHLHSSPSSRELSIYLRREILGNEYIITMGNSSSGEQGGDVEDPVDGTVHLLLSPHASPSSCLTVILYINIYAVFIDPCVYRKRQWRGERRRAQARRDCPQVHPEAANPQ